MNLKEEWYVKGQTVNRGSSASRHRVLGDGHSVLFISAGKFRCDDNKAVF